MDIRHPEHIISDYSAMIDRKEVRVNRDYQRSDQVWPRAAQSFLIETILTDYPIPKLFLHQRTDLRTRKTYKDIVDGQQRTRAIIDYYNDKYRLSSNVELPAAKGLKFSQLPEELQTKFSDYPLQFDLFVGATDEEVREVFRRMNSFTVPLNPEEQRHADHQGVFKWFMRRLSTEYGEAFRAAGTFTQKALVRMQDQKLLTEVCSAYFGGITTTNKRTLNGVYKNHDAEERFPDDERDSLDKRLRDGLDQMFTWDDLSRTPAMRPNQVYSLLLAVMHLQDAVETLNDEFDVSDQEMADPDKVLVNLTRLAEVLELDDEELAGPLGEFFKASASKTNVAAQRATRFRWYCRALVDDLPSE